MRFTLDPERLVDVTMPLSDNTPAWPGDTQFRREVREGHGFRTSRITMSSHSGTHLDAPGHLSELGSFVDGMPPSSLILPALVIDAAGHQAVGRELLDGLRLGGRALLLKTRAEPSLNLSMDYGHLSPEAACMAVDMGTSMVGIDTLSVDPPNSDRAHRTLLGAGIPVVENLWLEEISPGGYFFLCFPLRIESGDGSPVRAFLQPDLT